MDKVKMLQEKANVLNCLLEKYAQIDRDAEMVLRFMMPRFEQIRAGQIVPPHEHQYRWHFASTESPLYRKYDDLSHAASEYACALEDWESQAWYSRRTPPASNQLWVAVVRKRLVELEGEFGYPKEVDVVKINRVARDFRRWLLTLNPFNDPFRFLSQAIANRWSHQRGRDATVRRPIDESRMRS